MAESPLHTDITEEVAEALRSWGGGDHASKRGALNFHPAYAIQHVALAFRLGGYEDRAELFGVPVGEAFQRIGRDSQLHVIALQENSAGKLRAVQFSGDCNIFINRTFTPYDTSSTLANWSAQLQFDTVIESIFYCDRCFKTRVDHDKVPQLTGIALVQLSSLLSGTGIINAISAQMETGDWHCDDDGDVIGEGEQIKLRDPIMGGEIQVPVRPQHCEHAQCYDIATVVQIMGQTSSKHFRCAVCNVECDFTDLIFDKTFLNYMKLVRQLDARFKHQGVQRAAEAYHRVPTKLYETVARLQDPTNADERTQTDVHHLLVGTSGAVREEACVDLDGSSSSSSSSAQPRGTKRAASEAGSPKKKPRVKRRVISTISKQEEFMQQGSIAAFLGPGEDDAGNTVVIGRVTAMSPANPEGIATLRVRELKRVHADPPYFVSCATQWDEQSDTAAPVEGVWVSLLKSEHIHGETEAFELAEGEDTRLANLALDYSL